MNQGTRRVCWLANLVDFTYLYRLALRLPRSDNARCASSCCWKLPVMMVVMLGGIESRRALLPRHPGLLKNDRQALHPVAHDKCQRETCGGSGRGHAGGRGRGLRPRMRPACEPETSQARRPRNHRQCRRPHEGRAECDPHTAQAVPGVPRGLSEPQFGRMDRSPIRRSYHGAGGLAGELPATCRRVAENSRLRLAPMQA